MKKLFALAAFAAAMIFSACTGNKTVEEDLDFEKATPEAVVSALAEKLQAGDATTITTAIEAVQTQLNKLLENADVEKVTAYATQIKAFIDENAETLKSFNIDVTPLTNLFDQVKALPASAEDAATDALESAQEEAEGVVNDAVDAVQGAVDDAVDAGQKAVNDAVDAGKAAVEEGKAKTNEAIQNAADKLKL
ncbi:MAG: hypothetical protein IK144_08070 [Bacteroidaceae bacterium]|nr:hypothetical protein [Bacteroidaceae bacterium]